MNEIRIKEQTYPCRMTMGAMLRFKNETGKEIQELTGGSTSEVLLFLWCCVKSACCADGVACDMTAIEMADNIGIAEFSAWQQEAFPTDVKPSAPSKKKR